MLSNWRWLRDLQEPRGLCDPHLNSKPLADHGNKRDAMNEKLPELEDFATLYRRAFAQYGSKALWNMRLIDHPTPADALAITKALRTHGGMEGRRLAERMEKVCRAPH